MAHVAATGVPIGAIQAAGAVGGGGWATKIASADDGTMICCSDVAPPMFRGPSDTKWKRLINAGVNINFTNIARIGSTGGYDVAICATNSAYMYASVNGNIFKTTDGGATVTQTAFVTDGAAVANENLRMTGKAMAVDPINGNVLFYAGATGARFTTDGGATWTTISTATIPAPGTSGGNQMRSCVAFDRHSAQVSGKTQGIYIFVNGSGLYHSTNGGSTWAAVAGAPTNASHMAIGWNDGFVHLCGTGTGQTDGQYRRYDGTTWTAPTGINSKAIALHPSTAGHMWLVSIAGNLSASADNGVTWSGPSGANTLVATAIPWMGVTNEAYMSNGDICCNGSTGDLWVAEGIGCWVLHNPPTTISGGITWTEQTLGIESLTSLLIKSTPVAGNILYSCWDRTGFVIPRAQSGVVLPSAQMLTPFFQLGMDADYAPGNESTLVSIIQQGTGPIVNFKSGYSHDGGKTWTPFATDITSVTGNTGGGNIALLSNVDVLQLETNGGFLMYSPDIGATWTRVTIGTNLATSYGHHANYYSRRVLVKDRFTGGKALFYNCGDLSGSADDIACRGVWKITVSGGVAAATRISTTSINPSGFAYDASDGKLYQLSANHWMWFGSTAPGGLYLSTDDGVTWSAVTGTDNLGAGTSFGLVYAACAGYGPMGAGTQMIVVFGYRGVTPSDYTGWGLWVSVDNGATWTRMAQWPDGYFGFSADLCSDPTKFGRFAMSRSGEGVAQLNLVDTRIQS